MVDGLVLISEAITMNRNNQEPQHISDPQLLILTSLSTGPKHGYAIGKDVHGLSGTSLGTGALYGAIARLEGKGLISRLPADENRYPYRITPEGVVLLLAQLNAMRQLANHGLQRLGA